jgi:hypothetical protein
MTTLSPLEKAKNFKVDKNLSELSEEDITSPPPIPQRQRRQSGKVSKFGVINNQPKTNSLMEQKENIFTVGILLPISLYFLSLPLSASLCLSLSPIILPISPFSFLNSSAFTQAAGPQASESKVFYFRVPNQVQTAIQ